MLTVYHSNRLDVLRELLVELIRREPLNNPLAEEQILVQSPGMARWLQLELAETFSIAASLKFPLPATFLWDMFVTVLDGVPKRSAFAKDNMIWKLMGLLPEWLNDERFAPLQRYLENDDSRVRRYQLAGKIADIFDQYLVYRPEWITSWEAGEDMPELTAEQSWQPILWRALVERTGELGQSHWHRANMHQVFAATLEQAGSDDARVKRLPERLFVFGISALPPGYLESLHALGKHCQVHLMVTNPCRYYWGDIRDARYLDKISRTRFREGQPPLDPAMLDNSVNPLLASMGKLGRDYLFQLQDLGASEIDAFADIDDNSLLHSIQHDILELQDSTGSNKTITTDDNSLAFHGCHSPLREVEVLHDHLLHLFNKDSSLTPRDIIVMVPDIDSYGPYLQAVFGSAPKDRYIPFALSDRSASQEHPVLAALNRLMTLDQSRTSGPELIELLEVRAVQNRFSLDAGKLTTLSDWIHDAGIRWGLNEQHQALFDIPTREENTWLFGLRRMLLGYALPEQAGLYDDTLPCDLVQGMDAELAGQLADFIDGCLWLQQHIDTPRTAEQWIQFLNQMLERFFEPDADDENVLQTIREALAKFYQQLTDARFDEPLPRAVMADWLQENLNNSRNSQRFLAGQVNICTLMPMRSIPFKVVCLLGMNDSAYPRSLPPMGFDLMAKAPRRGDRSRREDDRYLFLEALLSARESLYISYVSRNIRDNTEKFPSVLVSELRTLISESYALQDRDKTLAEHLFTQHTLQAFSPGSFEGSSASFAREWLPAAQRNGKAPEPFNQRLLDEEEAPEELPLARLLAFWDNPCQAFCKQRLKIFFDEAEQTAETREPFRLNGLTKWQMKDAQVKALLEHQDVGLLKQQNRASGALPHGYFGARILSELSAEAQEIAELVSPWLKHPLADLKIAQYVNDSRLTGWLDGIHSHGRVCWRTGKVQARHRMRVWIEHLCYCLEAPEPAATICLSQGECFQLTPVNPEQAISMLSDLERYLREGLTRPLPFFPKTAWEWLSIAGKGAVLNDDDDILEKALAKARRAFNGDSYAPGEGDDAYIKRCLPDLDDNFAEMISLTKQIMFPLLAHYQKLEETSP